MWIFFTFIEDLDWRSVLFYARCVTIFRIFCVCVISLFLVKLGFCGKAAIQQTRCGSGRESMAPIRFFERKQVLNSKWDEAEKYISNPLSGEVPIQCLSSCVTAETERAHRPHSSARSISKSAPLPTPTSYERLQPHPVLTISEIKEFTFSGFSSTIPALLLPVLSVICDFILNLTRCIKRVIK